jgi:predicted transcriptional regulator
MYPSLIVLQQCFADDITDMYLYYYPLLMPSTYITYRSRYWSTHDIPNIKSRHNTGIEYAPSLTHWLTVKYFKGFIDGGLLRISQDAGPYRYYEITPNGLRYLHVFAEIEDDLTPDLR